MADHKPSLSWLGLDRLDDAVTAQTTIVLEARGPTPNPPDMEREFVVVLLPWLQPYQRPAMLFPQTVRRGDPTRGVEDNEGREVIGKVLSVADHCRLGIAILAGYRLLAEQVQQFSS